MILDKKENFQLKRVEEKDYKNFYKFYNNNFIPNESISKKFPSETIIFPFELMEKILKKNQSYIVTTNNNEIVSVYLVTDENKDNDVKIYGNFKKIMSFLNSFEKIPSKNYIEGLGIVTKDKYKNNGIATWIYEYIIKNTEKEALIVKTTCDTTKNICEKLNFFQYQTKNFEDIETNMFVYIKNSEYYPEYVWMSVKDKIAHKFNISEISEIKYKTFTEKIPISTSDNYIRMYKEKIDSLLNSNEGYLISTTTGSTSYPKMVLHKINSKIIDDNFLDINDKCLILDSFSLSTFLQKINNDILLLGANTIFLGPLNENNYYFTNSILQEININVLVGYPSSIYKFIKYVKNLNYKLNITKILTYGENINNYIKKYIYEIYGNVKLLGLYGGEDISCIGILNSEILNQENIYTKRKECFLEKINDKIYVTNLNDEIPIPNIRYNYGDTFDIFIENNIIKIKNIRRTNLSFLFFGNMIYYEYISNIVPRNIFQIILSKSDDIGDIFQLVILENEENKINTDLILTELKKIFYEIPEDNFNIKIIFDYSKLILKNNKKIQLIVDNRKY